MERIDLFWRFGVAIFIGILIGLQRQHASGEPDREMFAGVRTFALFALAGCLAAFVAEQLALAWAFVVIVSLLGLLTIVGYFVAAWHGSVGMTSEVAAMLTVLIGALAYWNQLALAVALGVTITVLLALKFELQRFAQRITREDVQATLTFAVITAIVLPVLPNQAYGPPPLDVLNPYNIWLMVVLISGINFLGYLLIKIVGQRQGIGLTGLLGGLVSSTAVTLSFSQRSQRQPEMAKPFALAITIAWTVMFARVLVLVFVLNILLLQVLWLPIIASMAAGIIYCSYLYFSQRAGGQEQLSFANPFELAPAIKFGLLYAAILLLSKAAQVYLDEVGIYLSSFFAGLADVDAITLSMAEFSSATNGLDLSVAARAIVLAAISNTVVKGSLVFITGTSSLRKTILPGFLLMVIVGVSFAFLI